jgi:hypothetical protein
MTFTVLSSIDRWKILNCYNTTQLLQHNTIVKKQHNRLPATGIKFLKIIVDSEIYKPQTNCSF